MMLRSALFLGVAFGLSQPALADVTLTKGPTPIPDGEAVSAGDITIQNERLAFTLAVESQAPWGVPRGVIVDLAPVKDGAPDLDRIAFADFIPNNWSAWPNTRLDVEVVTNTPEMAVIRITRDFGAADLETTYTLEAGSDRVHLVTKMTNTGSEPLADQISGFTLWPDSGYLFAVPGMAGVEEGSAEAVAAQAAADAMRRVLARRVLRDFVGTELDRIRIDSNLSHHELGEFTKEYVPEMHSKLEYYPGDRPSATILCDDLDAAALGALIAFHEHRTFANAVLMGINPFDQFGVELGKQMAKAIEQGGEEFDASTESLLAAAGLN